MCAMKCICSAGVLGGPSEVRQLLSLQYLQLIRDGIGLSGSEPTLQLNACALGLRAYLLKRAHRGWLPNYSELR